jgi:NAD(P)-dependent dehydrogenase (short-subunit alcohol dehydrogenase family)
MELNLSNKVALVSGSGRGIGKAIAEELAKEGCTLFLNDNDEGALEKAFLEIKEKTSSKNIYKLCSDLIATENIKVAIGDICRTTGGNLDIVIANIGTGRSTAGWNVDDEEWERMFDINFFGAVRLCRESLRIMKERGAGSIV